MKTFFGFRMKRLILATWVLTTAACSPIFEESDLEGVWYSSCYVDGTNSKRTCYIISGNDLTILTRTWVSNVNCPGTANFENSDTGVYELGDELDSPSNSREMDVDLATDFDYFDLMQLKSSTVFQVGDKSGSSDGSTIEKRPTSAEGIDYTKQSNEISCDAMNG